ncbi:MAG TPA: VTT domain-containing protein [Solirubrobacterales bacterium]|nr:VTT domain-containing protein [Solirubrobacterales bacterium]
MLSAPHLLALYGVVGLTVILFLETGLVLGLILPGETLAILAGAYSHVGHAGAPHPQLGLVIAAAALGAVVGGQVGYLLGRLMGAPLLERPDGRVFKRRQLERTHQYFARFGARTIVIARFVPFVRTLASPVAGIAMMPAKTFSMFNLLGGILWAVTVSLTGYALGGLLDVNRNALAITLGILALSLLPLLLHRLRRLVAADF